MSLKTDLYTLLTTDAAVNAIVGLNVYPQVVAKEIPSPFIAYYFIAQSRSYSHQGYSSIKRTQVQVSCFSRTPDQAETLGNAVVAALHGWNYKEVFITDFRELYDDGTKFYHVPVTFNVAQEE